MNFLTENFLNQYPDHPTHMSNLGLFTYYRTYARFLPDKGRRETWKEMVARSVDYNMTLELRHRRKMQLPLKFDRMKSEAEELFDNVFNLRQFLAGRTFWIGGTAVSDKYPMANFNCSFTNIESWNDLGELFYLLMLGSGVGFKCTPEMAKKIPPVRKDTTLILSPYEPVPTQFRLENTSTKILENGFAKIYVGDSKEGWRDAFLEYMKLLSDKEFENVHTIKVSFNSVRPQGERLKQFGGTASGPKPLMDMFIGIDNVLKNKVDPSLKPLERAHGAYYHVRPIHILDIGNMIGCNVVSGGVRRTAEIFLFDPSDYECMFAKYGINGFWSNEHFTKHEAVVNQMKKMGMQLPSWMDEIGEKHYDDNVNGGQPYNFGRQNIGHRRLSNNSITFFERPSEDMLHLIFMMIQLDGEPGFVNLQAGMHRRDNMNGVNPCGEILLDSKQQCNLTTINLVRFMEEGCLSEDGDFPHDKLCRAQELSARAALRMSLIDLELPEWDFKQKRDRLIGCSMTGFQDATSSLDSPVNFLTYLKDVARAEADEYASELRIPAPLLVTTVKPEGTLSLVAGGVSPGIHFSHAPYYIRRIRVSADDALAKMAKFLGWPIHPEIGTPDDDIEKARTIIIDFPVKSDSKFTKNDIGALDQLNWYMDFQKYYTEHNASNTITVKPNEWDVLERAIYNEEVWNSFVGVSFLPHDGGTYKLAPYEAINKEQYEELAASFQRFDPDVLEAFELSGTSDLDGDDACGSGGCPVR